MASGTAVLGQFPGGQNCSDDSENSFVAFVHGNILTSFAICSLQSLGRVESRLFAESIDIELKRPEPKWKWELSLTCVRSAMSWT